MRITRGLLATAVVLVLGWPAVQPHPGDGFPISSYPMFARTRGSGATIDVAVGILPGGGEVRLGPDDVAGTDEVMLAAKTLRHAVRGPRTSLHVVCLDIAERLSGDVTAVEIRTETYDALAWFEGRRRPTDVVTRERCGDR